MLDKRVCQNCIDNLNVWHKGDEAAWEGGYVTCPLEVDRSLFPRRIKLDPPEDCPMYLEQLMASRGN